MLVPLGDDIGEIVLGASMLVARPEPGALYRDYFGFAACIIDWPAAPTAGSFFAILGCIPASVYRIKGWVKLKEKSTLTAMRCKPRVLAGELILVLRHLKFRSWW